MSKEPYMNGMKATEMLAGLAFTLLLAGCATSPFLGDLVQPKDTNKYESATAFTAALTPWPSEQWWRRYQDLQLDHLVDEALRDSPDMAVAAARLREVEAARHVAEAELMPQISANASVTEQKQSYNYLSPPSVTPQGWHNYGQASLDFSWEIDFWGRNRAGLSAAISELEAGRAEMAQAKLALSTAVVSEYIELARLFSARDTAAEVVKVRSGTAELLVNRFTNGLETRAAIGQAEARRATAEGNFLQIGEQIERQRDRLAALLGAGPDRGSSIGRPTLRMDQAFGLPTELAFDLLGHRPDIVAARLQVQARSSRIDQRRAEFYPNVNLVAFLGVQSLGLDTLTKEGSGIGGIGPALSLPIFSGGRLEGELRGARARYDEAVALYDQTVTRAMQEVADAALSLQALAPQLAKADEAVDSATEARRVSDDRYKGGLSNYIEVLGAEDILLDSLRSRTELRSRSLSLDVALMRALGGGYQSKKTTTN